MTQPVLPLEIKIHVIRALSSYYGPRHAIGADLKKAYFRDLGTVCLVWPDTIAVVRKIIFEKISLRFGDHRIDSSLRNLCQALGNDPNLSTYVHVLEFSDWDPSRSDGALPQPPASFPTAATRPLFLSFLSFIPQMHQIEFLKLNNMRFQEDNSLEFLNDLRALEGSSVKDLTINNSTFSISAFNTFLGYWGNRVLNGLDLYGMSLIPHSTDVSNQLEEEIFDRDENDTSTEREVDKPGTLTVLELDLKSSDELGSDMLTLLRFLVSEESPLGRADTLNIKAGGSAMTATTVILINKLIRRYKVECLDFKFCDFKDAIGTRLYVSGLEIADMVLRIRECFSLANYDEAYFDWYVESLAAVPPNNSRLREFSLELQVHVPFQAGDLGEQGVQWGVLDAVLCGKNLQFDTVTINVVLPPSPNGADHGLVQKLLTWLTEVCFPKVTAKYLVRGVKEGTSALTVMYYDAERYGGELV